MLKKDILKHYHWTLLLTLEGSALAMTRNTPATSELEIHIFDPLMTYSLPSFFATVFRAKASEPEVGSVRQKLPAWKEVERS